MVVATFGNPDEYRYCEVHRCNARHWKVIGWTMCISFGRKRDAMDWAEKFVHSEVDFG